MVCLTEINFSDLTNGKVVTNGTEMEWNGSGVFDKLMAAVNKNIKIQYDEGKIKGVDYANVYMESLQTVLQQSIEFVLREKLVEAQIEGIKMDNIVKEFEIEVKIPKELEMLNKQVELAEQEVLVKKEQVEQLKAQTEQAVAQTALLTRQQLELELNGVADRASKEAQTSLYIRQEKGFDDNKNQKLFEAQMNAWSLMFSSGMLTDKPSIITDKAVDALYDKINV
jgi:hypothetical protein